MKSGVKLKRKSNGLGECGDHVLDDCLKKIVDEKSSFGNGWRFFYAEKSDGGQVVAGSTSGVA